MMRKVDLDVAPGVEAKSGPPFVGAVAEQRLGADHIAPQLHAPRDPFELAKLLERVDARVRVGADTEADAPLTHAADREEAVAQVRLRGRARADPRPGLGEQVELRVVGVRCVDDRRARAQATGARQQLDGADAVLGEALLELARLLVGVDVEDETFGVRVPGDRLEPVGRAGTHGVGGDADAEALRAEPRDVVEVVVDACVPEALDTAARIGGVEEDEADARGGSRLRGGERFVVAEVVELADCGIAGGTHLTVGKLVVSADGLGGLALGLGDHRVAPAPEVVAFGLAAQATLERVAVDVDEAGDREALRHGAINLSDAPFLWRSPPPPRGDRIEKRRTCLSRKPSKSAPPSSAGLYPCPMSARAVPAPLAAIPNALTVLRLALIPVFVVLLVPADEGESLAAAVVFAVAGISDYLDGWLARRWNVQSAFGRVADPLADRLMIDAAVIILVLVHDRLPWIALALIIGRDILLVAGYKLVMPPGYELTVNFLGKAATWVLYCALVFVLLTDESASWPLWLFWAGLGLALVAGIQYAATAIRGARA